MNSDQSAAEEVGHDTNDTDRSEEPFDMDVADDEEVKSITDTVVGNRYRDTRRGEEFTVTKAETVTSTAEGHRMEASCLFFDWEVGSTGHQNVDDFQTLLTAGVYEEVDSSNTDTGRSKERDAS